MNKFNRAILLVGLVLVFIHFFYLFELAQFKPFWLDEAFDHRVSFAKDNLWTLINGASRQCSRAPLYFLVQRPINSSIDFYTDAILVHYRIVSIVSATLLMAAYFIFFSRYFSLAAGILFMAPLGFHPSFANYANEARPYMLWLLCLGLALLSTLSLTTLRVRNFILFILSGIALFLVASPGFIQLAVLCSSIYSYFWFENRNSARKNPTGQSHWHIRQKQFLIYFIPLILIATAVGLYYLRANCNLDPGHSFDLLQVSWNSKYQLLYHVFQLFWPTMGLFSQVLNLLLVIGLCSPFLVKSSRYKLTLWVVLPQILLFFPLAALTAWSHYYFVPRLFIFLILGRALFISLGWSALQEFLIKKLESRELSVTWVKPVFITFALLFVGRSLSNWNNQLERYRADTQKAVDAAFDVQIDCSQWTHSLYELWYEGNRPPEDISNAIVGLDRSLKKCPKIPNLAPQSARALFLENPTTPYFFKVLTTDPLPKEGAPLGIPGNFYRFTQSGRQVFLKNDRSEQQ